MTVSSISLSASGKTLWLLCNNSVFACHKESEEGGSSGYILLTRPLTCRALHISGDDGVFFCIKDDYKVCSIILSIVEKSLISFLTFLFKKFKFIKIWKKFKFI